MRRLLSAVFVWALPLLPVAAQAPLDLAPLADWLQTHRNIETLEAGFRQERRLPTVRQPLVTRGRFWLKGDRFRWQLGEPPKTIAIKTGESVTLIDTENRKSRKVSAADPRVKPFAVLADPALSSLAAFQQQFAVESTQRVKDMYQATVSPRDRRLRGRVPRIVLHIDPRTSTLRATEVQAEDGSVILTVFDVPKIGAPVPDSVFQP